MTDEEKKAPEGGPWPAMFVIRLLVWTLLFSFVGLFVLGKIG